MSYLKLVHKEMKDFDIIIKQVPRLENSQADALAQLATNFGANHLIT